MHKNIKRNDLPKYEKLGTELYYKLSLTFSKYYKKIEKLGLDPDVFNIQVHNAMMHLFAGMLINIHGVNEKNIFIKDFMRQSLELVEKAEKR